MIFALHFDHCWLEDIRNLKINDRKIATYFWYLWIFLTLPQVWFFWYVFGFQVALQSFFLKGGILSRNFLWTILMWKKLALEAFESISCPKISSKQQYLKFENFLTIFEKELSTKNFSSKFQLWEKMIAAPPGSRTHIKKTILAAKSGIFRGIKNM